MHETVRIAAQQAGREALPPQRGRQRVVPNLRDSTRPPILSGAGQVRPGQVLERHETDDQFWLVPNVRDRTQDVHREQVRNAGDEGSAVPSVRQVQPRPLLQDHHTDEIEQERILDDRREWVLVQDRAEKREEGGENCGSGDDDAYR